MKRKHLSSFTVILLIVVMIMSACGSKKNASYDSKTDTASPMETTTEESMDLDYTGESSDSVSNQEKPEEEIVQNESKNSSSVETNRKLIKRVQMDVETKDFEGLIKSINSKVDSLKGYMETSEINGNTYYDQNGSRYAHMVIRIPSTNLNKFVISVKELGNVLNSSESAEDITLQYVDVESHKKALIVEQDSLLVILKNAKKLEDIIKIEERLSEVRYEIGSYESQIRTFDNLVDYSTITLDINEVQHITPVEDKTVFQRMQSGLGNTFYNLKTGAQNFAVWFVVNLPYLIIWAVIIIIIVFVIRKYLNKMYQKDRSPIQINNSTEKEAISNKEDLSKK